MKVAPIRTAVKNATCINISQKVGIPPNSMMKGTTFSDTYSDRTVTGCTSPAVQRAVLSPLCPYAQE